MRSVDGGYPGWPAINGKRKRRSARTPSGGKQDRSQRISISAGRRVSVRGPPSGLNTAATPAGLFTFSKMVWRRIATKASIKQSTSRESIA
jgi:hypothetical protein